MDSVIKWIERFWHFPIIGWAALPITTFLIISFNLPEKFDAVTTLSIASGCAIIAVFVWWQCNRIRRHPKGTTGFDLLLQHEDPKQEAKIRADFITHLRGLLEESDVNFSFIEHPAHICVKYSESKNIKKLARKTRGSFVIFGRTKLRLINGKEQHVFEIRGGVRHAATREDISDKIAAELTETLGSEVIISQENDLFGFRVTAKRLEIASEYIVGIAALVSNDLSYAKKLFKSVETSIAREAALSQELTEIKARLPLRLREVGILKCNQLVDRYVFGGLQHKDIELLDQELQAFETYIKNWYGYRLASAMCSFVLRRDLKQAWKHILACKDIPDTAWCYSAAFLSAYQGDLKRAWHYYQKAFIFPPSEPSIANQCEDFINQVLIQEPQKVQFWYCLGLINLKAKNDPVAAKNDFSKFLTTSCPKKYSVQHHFANRYLKIIESDDAPGNSETRNEAYDIAA